MGPNTFYNIMTTEKKRVDFSSALPPEISLEILSYLHVPDLLSLRCVNHEVKKIVDTRLSDIVKLYKKYITELNFKEINIPFSDYYREFSRLCIDYEIPASLQSNIAVV